MKQPDPPLKALLAFVRRLGSMPTENDTLASTWNPPEWEQMVAWWNEYVEEARKLTGVKYR